MISNLDKSKNSLVFILASECSKYLTVNSTTFIVPSFSSQQQGGGGQEATRQPARVDKRHESKDRDSAESEATMA